MKQTNSRKDVLDERHDTLSGRIATGSPTRGSTSFMRSKVGIALIIAIIVIMVLWRLLA